MPATSCPPGYVIDWTRQPRRLPAPLPVKEQRACCVARRDELGRLPIGFCSAGCEGRVARDAAVSR